MNREEAKFILSSYRPGGEDANDPQFHEALALAKADPELGIWFAEELERDAAISRKLKSISAPAGLRSNILAGQKISRSHGIARRAWLAWAACLVALVSGLMFWMQRPAEADFAVFEREMTEFLTHQLDHLDYHTEDIGEIKSWLATRGAHEDFVLPAGLTTLPGLGCRVLDWRGNAVALVCFKRGSEEAHLLVMDRNTLRNAPQYGETQFGQSGLWTTASWSRGEKVYMLTAKGDRESVARFL
jgi:hypothetical protein